MIRGGFGEFRVLVDGDTVIEGGVLAALSWISAPVNRGDAETALTVNPFHTSGIKWAMRVAVVVLVLWSGA